MNVVAYARFSSDNQREESIDAQVRAIRKYCDNKQYSARRKKINDCICWPQQ